jgi:replicative DNA helicase
MQWVHNIARRNAPALMFSAEMNRTALMERGLAEVSGVDFEELRKKQIDQGTYDRLMRAAEAMAKMPVAIDDTSAIKTKQMLARAQRFKRQHGLSLVVFDYMELAGDDGGESEQLRITRISHALKGMAKQLQVPVVALSQLSRKVEERTPPIPRMSDIRMSGAIEADADKILFLYRHDYYIAQGFPGMDPDPEKEGITDIIIGKQRNGETGLRSVRFDGAKMRFTNLSDHPADSYTMRTLV